MCLCAAGPIEKLGLTSTEFVNNLKTKVADVVDIFPMVLISGLVDIFPMAQISFDLDKRFSKNNQNSVVVW